MYFRSTIDTSRSRTGRTSQKRMKLFEYFKRYVATNRFVFLQETHSSIRDEKKWEHEFKSNLFFPHGKTNLMSSNAKF